MQGYSVLEGFPSLPDWTGTWVISSRVPLFPDRKGTGRRRVLPYNYQGFLKNLASHEILEVTGHLGSQKFGQRLVLPAPLRTVIVLTRGFNFESCSS